jgi:TonB-linked SusC/RagA family outer membrane protein
MKKHKIGFCLKFSVNKMQKSKSLEKVFTLLLIIFTLNMPVISGNKHSNLDNPYSANVKNEADQAQDGKINGIVYDETGAPMIGVSIVIKGTTKATITDVNGQFSLDISSNDAILVFSYIGYSNQEIKAGSRNNLKVTLQPNTKMIDEVVVVGYGVQKKSNVTGSIASIRGDELANLSNTNAASAIQGKVSGVQVMNNSGAPGATSTLRIRGFSSNGSSNPLYIVDGLKVPDIDYLEPENIKSIEVLKDGASAAIYGAEAGNGVILITTKSGNKNEGKIFLNTQNTFSSVGKKLDLLNAKDYTTFMLEAYPERTDEFNAYYFNDPSSMINGKLADTDWQNALFSTGYKQRYNIGFQGGNNDGSLFVSLGYLNQDGIIVGPVDTYKKYSGQINGNYKIKKWLEIGVTTSLEYSKSQAVSESSNNYSATLSNLGIIDPLTPLEYNNGLAGASPLVQQAVADGSYPLINPKTNNYYGVSYWTQTPNPLASLYASSQYAEKTNVNGTFYANFKPIDNFVFTSRFGYRINNTYNSTYQQPNWMSPTHNSNTPYLDNSQVGLLYYQWENFANYSFDIKKNHFSILAGTSFIQSETNTIEANTDQLQSSLPNYRYLNYSTPSANDHVSGNTLQNAQIAYYGRLSWDYADKYNLQCNFRADAYDAAYLDLTRSWGYFPSISGGWTISNEKFMSPIVDNKSLSFAKLRLSYGKNGNISNLSPYMYASTLKAGASGFQNAISYNYYMNDKLYTAVYPNSALANPSLRWEESVQSDIGLDLRFFKDRLTLTAEFYNKNTDGLLVNSPSNLTTGTSTVWKNVGLVNNHGFEFELGWKGEIAKGFKYNIKGNIATVSNMVEKYLGKGVRLQGSAMSYFEEGYPVWYLRAYKVKGIDPATGRAIYEDTNKDGQITNADETYAGSAIPDFTYGLTVSFNYKNFDLNIYGTGVQGSKIFYYKPTDNPLYNRLQGFYTNRWTATNTNASYPSAFYQTADPLYPLSDAFIFDGSFFKIKQIQLGYNFSKELIKRLSIADLRAYVSMDNFFTFTKYPGLDPEVRPQGDPSLIATDMGGYPSARSITFGLNITF